MKNSLLVTVFLLLITLIAFYYNSSVDNSSNDISIGEMLYEHHCTNCHSINLRKGITGPPLGNVTKFRSQEYLRSVTKNMNDEIRNENLVAVCLYNQWNGINMGNFEFLDETQIDSIYAFIEKESHKQNIEKNEISYVIDCELNKNPKRYFDGSGKILEKPKNSSPNILREIHTDQFYKYYFKRYLRLEPAIEQKKFQINNFVVKSKLPRNRLILGFYIYKNLEILNKMQYFKDSFYFTNPQFNEENFELYNDNEIRIILIEKTVNNNIYFGWKDVKFDKINQVHEIDLKLSSKYRVKEIINWKE